MTKRQIGNYTSISPLQLCERTGLSIEEIMEWFDQHFGGYAKYVRQCENKELGATLDALELKNNQKE